MNHPFIASDELTNELTNLKILLDNALVDVEKASKGNKAAHMRLRCFTRRLHKLTKTFRDLSMKETKVNP